MILSYPVYKILFFRQKHFRSAFKLMRLHAAVLLFLMGIKIKLKSPVPKLPEGPFLICPNHSSFLDIPCLYQIFPDYFTFIGKNEIRKWPLFRIFYTSGMNILVDRSSTSSKIKTLKRMSEEIESGNSLCIFPEGTISKKAPLMNEFKKGAFAVAVKKQVPVLPVVFISNYKRMQRGSFFFGNASPGISYVQILEPFITKGLDMKDLDKPEKKIFDQMQKILIKSQTD